VNRIIPMSLAMIVIMALSGRGQEEPDINADPEIYLEILDWKISGVDSVMELKLVEGLSP
jgi:hypothetical protein